MHSFLKVNNWFEKKYQKKMDARYFTMKIALNLLLQFKGKNIVETGCIREKDDFGAGYSTYLFGEFCEKYGMHLWTCDNTKKHLDLAKWETGDFVGNITYVLEDSKIFLHKFNDYYKKIDLLYLDALDCDPDNEAKTVAAQMHQADEIKIAYPKLAKHAVILLDDNAMPWGGKTKLAKEFLVQRKFINILDYQQSIWVRF